MMRRMFASSFGCFSSLLGLRRLDKSLTQTMPARNSLSPSSTVERPQPNTSSAVRALPSNNASVTSAIACRRSGHATRFTRRPANSTAHSGICLFSNRDFFMCLALFLVAHENTYKWYVSNYVIPNGRHPPKTGDFQGFDPNYQASIESRVKEPRANVQAPADWHDREPDCPAHSFRHTPAFRIAVGASVEEPSRGQEPTKRFNARRKVRGAAFAGPWHELRYAPAPVPRELGILTTE